MTDEITQTHGLVLTAHRAWNGLSVIVEQTPTAVAVVETAKLNSNVIQWTLKTLELAMSR